MALRHLLKSYAPRYSKFVFVVLLLVISLLYNFQEIIFLKPQGNHFWRQTDCLSITLNYCKEDRGFFEPSIHQIGVKDNGKTVSDFPLFYYLVGKTWRVTGQHEYIFRGLVLLIFLSALFCLFKTLEDIFKDSVWAILITLLFFTSPILVFYGTGFLMNAPAFSFALIGWYIFYQYYKTGKFKWLWISFLFFSLAGILKSSALISLFSLAGIFVLERFGFINFKHEGKLFTRPKWQFIPFAIALLLVIGWVFFAISYNDRNNRSYFLVGIAPFWNLPKDIGLTKFHDFFTYWIKHNHSLATQILAVLAWIAVLSFPKKNNKFFYYMNIVLPIGFLAFIILFGEVLVGHDYYWIDMMIVMVFVFSGFVILLKKSNQYLFKWGKIVFALLLIYNVAYCSHNMYDRYHGMFVEYYNFYMKSFSTIEPYNRSLGISREDRVISLPDVTINGSLYLMDQKGWTTYGAHAETDEYYRDRISRGAEYLFISDSTLLGKDYLQPYILNKIGQYESISIFRLPEK